MKLLIIFSLGEREMHRAARISNKREILSSEGNSFGYSSSSLLEVPIDETHHYKILPMHPQVSK